MSRGKWAIVLAIVVVLAAVAAAYAAGQAKAVPVQEVVRAKRFEVVDAAGRAFAVLSSFGDGSEGLVLYDRADNPRVRITVSPDGTPIAVLYDSHGKKGVDLQVPPGGGGGGALCLYDTNGRSRVMLSVLQDGSPTLVFMDGEHKIREVLGLLPDGGPFLDLSDKDEKQRASLGTSSLRLSESGILRPTESSLVLIGKDGKVLWQAP